MHSTDNASRPLTNLVRSLWAFARKESLTQVANGALLVSVHFLMADCSS